jgi:hypothetical protein
MVTSYILERKFRGIIIHENEVFSAFRKSSKLGNVSYLPTGVFICTFNYNSFHKFSNTSAIPNKTHFINEFYLHEFGVDNRPTLAVYYSVRSASRSGHLIPIEEASSIRWIRCCVDSRVGLDLVAKITYPAHVGL